MNEGLREGLSAFMDGEGDDVALRRILAKSDDPALRARWARYHLARDLLHGGAAAVPPEGFAAAVRAVVEGEGDARAAGGGAWRSLASFAVAASVTAVLVIGGRQLAGEGEPARPLASPVAPVNGTGAAAVRASYGTRALPPLEAAAANPYEDLARERLRRFSQEHAEHAALNTPQGLLPYARVPRLDGE